MSALATVTIPVVVHVISENGTRASGNIPDSMINNQISVLNEAYAGGTGGAATAFAFQLQRDQPGDQRRRGTRSSTARRPSAR